MDGTVITMAHAKLLAAFAVDNPGTWKQRVQQDKLDARGLKQALRKELGKQSPSRKRVYIQKTKDGLRIYPVASTPRWPRPSATRRSRRTRKRSCS